MGGLILGFEMVIVCRAPEGFGLVYTFGILAREALPHGALCLRAPRVHVPKRYILWPQSTYIGTTLRPKYILFEYTGAVDVKRR